MVYGGSLGGCLGGGGCGTVGGGSLIGCGLIVTLSGKPSLNLRFKKNNAAKITRRINNFCWCFLKNLTRNIILYADIFFSIFRKIRRINVDPKA